MNQSCSTHTRCATRDSLALLLRLGLGGMLVFAGYLKLGFHFIPGLEAMDPLNMYFALKKFELGMPEPLMSFLAYLVPWTELLTGMALVLGVWARSAALIVAVMMGAFIAGIASLMIRGISEPCTCFGAVALFCPKNSPMGWCHIIRNSGFALAAIYVLVRGPGFLALDNLRGWHGQSAARVP